ncbi:hypothetical protein LQZ18_19015 [Lachnospiraceae bacterium ZAX-1]
MGAGPGAISMIHLTRMILLNAVPIFFIAAYLQNNLTNTDGLVELRMKSRGKSFSCMVGAAIFFATLYIAGILVLLAAAGTLFGKTMHGMIYYADFFYFPMDATYLFLLAGGVRLAELIFAIMVLAGTSIILKNTISGMGIYVGMLIFYFADIKFFRRLCFFGISSMARFESLGSGTTDAIRNIMLYCIFGSVIVGAIPYQVWKRKSIQG